MRREVAHYWLGTTVPLLGSLTCPATLLERRRCLHLQHLTLDLRYRRPPRPLNWCGEAFTAKLLTDTTIK
jgi:hypothetical protein